MVAMQSDVLAIHAHVGYVHNNVNNAALRVTNFDLCILASYSYRL